MVRSNIIYELINSLSVVSASSGYLLLLFLLLSLLSQSLPVFFLCIGRVQTMNLERQSLESIILFIIIVSNYLSGGSLN